MARMASSRLFQRRGAALENAFFPAYIVSRSILNGLFDSSGERTTTVYRMMITFETMTMLANLAMKLTMTAGLFLIDTRMSVMIKVTA